MTRKLTLSIAIGAYDHVRDLMTGEVGVDGIELIPMHGPIEELLYRTHHHAEWDVTELGFGGYCARLDRGEQPYVAIPAFTSRVFRHSALYVRADAGIDTPEQLNGKRIGMPEWGMAAAVWARGMLADQYGLDPQSVSWVQGGLHEPGRVDRAPPDPRLGLRYRSERGRSLDELLVAGELDALISARTPRSLALPGSPVRRLFGADLAARELAYWKDSGLFPVMHLIGIRREVYDQHRWIARQLFVAFEQAKNRSLARAFDTSSSYFPVPLLLHAVQTAVAVAGDDLWPYGVDANRPSIDAFLRYAHEQGVTQRRLDVDELFAPEATFLTRT